MNSSFFNEVKRGEPVNTLSQQIILLHEILLHAQ